MSSNKDVVNAVGPVQRQIEAKLAAAFSPVHLDVLNESHQHNVPKNSETHFKVIVISESFENKKLLDRHRLVNEALSEELQTGVHALSITSKTPSQWEASGLKKSPACLGGMAREQK